MRVTDVLLAVIAAALMGYTVHGLVEADWAGPVAGVITLIVLLGLERARRGGRRAR